MLFGRMYADWKKEKGMTKSFDDSNWREEYKGYTSNKKHLELLENGA